MSPTPKDRHSLAAETLPDGLILPELEAGAEPVPGYRLVARLGGGGSGEVWKARGPGGFPVAMKFVPLHDEEARVELGSLELMKEIRHAHLLPLFGAWQCHGLLVVGMELADRTLWDRFQEAARQGLPGIPRPELLELMRQAAQGVDYLNEPCHALLGREGIGIQHGDVKPRNLFLVGGSVKVGDFGLAKSLHEAAGGPPGSLTPAYAAPEFFRGQTSGRSDQYSLAVTYCQLRGGRLPFTGNPYEVMMGHLLDAPDLTMLPEAERPAVARALAKRPEERWPDCRTFVRELAGAAGRRGSPGPRVYRRLAAAVGLLALLGVPTVASLSKSSPGAARDDLPEAAAALQGQRAGPREGEAAAASEKEPPCPAVPRGEAPRPDPPDVRAQLVGPPAPQQDDLEGQRRAAEALAERRRAEEEALRQIEAQRQAAAERKRAEEEALRQIEEERRAAAERKRVEEEELKKLEDERRAAEARKREDAAAQEKPVPRAATIHVLMPSAAAELVVRGDVGKGNPDEWYGPKRIIHTPPLKAGADYLVGAFWTDKGKQLTRKSELKVEPGRVYEVDLRPSEPTWREVKK